MLRKLGELVTGGGPLVAIHPCLENCGLEIRGWNALFIPKEPMVTQLYSQAISHGR